MKQPVYFDYAATTPVDPRVAKVLTHHLSMDGIFGNPASVNHPFGWKALNAVDVAREQVARAIHAGAREIVWTSGATESNNLAIKGAAYQYQSKGKHIVTMQSEHKAVLDTCRFLETQGFEVTYLAPESNGLLSLETLKAALRPDTVLVSIMMVNNETGVIQDIQAIGEMVKANGSLFHVDAVQAFGKLPIDLRELPVDLMSLTAHKIYGPKGIGVLYVRILPKVRLQPLIHGGGHEHGLRSGTLPVHQIAALGEAFDIAEKERKDEAIRIAALRDRLWKGLQALSNVRLNAAKAPRVSGILNVAFEGLESEVMVKAMPQLAVASGAACNSAVIEPSHVLKAMQMDRATANASLRFSLGRFTTEEEVDFAIGVVVEKVGKLL
jgi:cysteine desulfurase